MVTDHILDFQKIIYDFYRAHKRNFLWRHDITPYRILVSEIMLQQTQTSRVEPKFVAWLERFPDILSLAVASKQQVLSAWQGLGYNRRGLALHVGAQRIVDEFGGNVPNDPEILETFTGIGQNTAASICAFAFNVPVVFIETNIRTVFLHHFFGGQEKVHDKQLMPLIASTVDNQNPREWYYALMDYGVHIKKELKANNKLSQHYVCQSRFMGSRRQVRGAIIRILSSGLSLSYDDLYELVYQQLPDNHHNISVIVQDLIREHLIRDVDGLLQI